MLEQTGCRYVNLSYLAQDIRVVGHYCLEAAQSPFSTLLFSLPVLVFLQELVYPIHTLKYSSGGLTD